MIKCRLTQALGWTVCHQPQDRLDEAEPSPGDDDKADRDKTSPDDDSGQILPQIGQVVIDPDNQNGGRLVYVSATVGVYRNVDGVEYFQNIDDLQVVAGRDCPAVPAVDRH